MDVAGEEHDHEHDHMMAPMMAPMAAEGPMSAEGPTSTTRDFDLEEGEGVEGAEGSGSMTVRSAAAALAVAGALFAL